MYHAQHEEETVTTMNELVGLPGDVQLHSDVFAAAVADGPTALVVVECNADIELA
jgi:hypothetical protein